MKPGDKVMVTFTLVERNTLNEKRPSWRLSLHLGGDRVFNASLPEDLLLPVEASVDLATCELPVDVLHKTIGPGVLKDRCGPEGWVEWPDGSKSSAIMSKLRPLDAPDPESGVERLRARVAQLEDPHGNLPDRIRVGQDDEGFWTCREAYSGSPEYVRADLYDARTSERDDWREVARRAGVCMTCAIRALEPYGCADCLNTGWRDGAPAGFVDESLFKEIREKKQGDARSAERHREKR